jgi:hypothetical protein
MNDDFDLNRLGDIADPFAQDATAPVRPADRSRFPLGAPSPTRARVWRARAIALAAAVAYEVAVLVLHRHRPDLGSASAWSLVLGITIPLCASALALSAAIRRGPRGLGLPAAYVAAVAVAAPLFFVAATVLAAPPDGGDPLFWRHAAGCMAVTAILALGPMALGLWAFRHAFAASAGWRTAALGVAAGALSASTMSLACPITAAGHVLLGHGVVMLVTALVGGLLAPLLARS